MKIVYIGLKEIKADNVAGTRLAWTRGQIHEVEDEVKAALLLKHPTIWANADKEYSLLHKPEVVPPTPRVSVIPTDAKEPYWEPVVLPVPEEIFKALQAKELVTVFMTKADADAFARWKQGRQDVQEPGDKDGNGGDTAPKETGPKPDLSQLDKRTKAYKDAAESAGLEKKKVA